LHIQPHGDHLWHDRTVDTAAGIFILVVSVVSVVVVLAAFVWAARKDGEEDRALQKRLGIRRRTRMGR
jgi:hypothetical protein